MSQSRVRKAMEAHFYPPEGESAPPKRFTIVVDAEVHQKVQEVADKLDMSWARAANLLLLPAAQEALDWMTAHEALLEQAVQDGQVSMQDVLLLAQDPDDPERQAAQDLRDNELREQIAEVRSRLPRPGVKVRS